MWSLYGGFYIHFFHVFVSSYYAFRKYQANFFYCLHSFTFKLCSFAVQQSLFRDYKCNKTYMNLKILPAGRMRETQTMMSREAKKKDINKYVLYSLLFFVNRVNISFSCLVTYLFQVVHLWTSEEEIYWCRKKIHIPYENKSSGTVNCYENWHRVAYKCTDRRDIFIEETVQKRGGQNAKNNI
jgi:hypothetical protein